jgi:hypothetical protein
MANQYTTKGQAKRTRMVPIRLTEDEFDVLSMVAAAQQCSLSLFMRYCLMLEPLGETQRKTMLTSLRAAARRKLAKKGS